MIVLVTGGTGTLGQVLVPMLFDMLNPTRVRVLSRGEHKQSEMEEHLRDLPIDYFVGDVRDKDRIWYATKGVDMVFHLAAVKSVDKAEYNPNEAIETNITGTQNVVDACIKHGVHRAIFTSTDKAAEPLNVYGATKLTAERLFIQSNSYSGENGCQFGAVRYGNVLGSNGSVIQKWNTCIKEGQKPKLTNPDMTRFWITRKQAAEFVLWSMKSFSRGEVRIPKMKACTMGELYRAFCYSREIDLKPNIVGVRQGEKMAEKLFGDEEVPLVTDVTSCWVRWPNKPQYPVQVYGSQVKEPVSSSTVTKFKSEELITMIKGVLKNE